MPDRVSAIIAGRAGVVQAARSTWVGRWVGGCSWSRPLPQRRIEAGRRKEVSSGDRNEREGDTNHAQASRGERRTLLVSWMPPKRPRKEWIVMRKLLIIPHVGGRTVRGLVHAGAGDPVDGGERHH